MEQPQDSAERGCHSSADRGARKVLWGQGQGPCSGRDRTEGPPMVGEEQITLDSVTDGTHQRQTLLIEGANLGYTPSDHTGSF